MITVQQMVRQMRETLANGKPKPFSIVVCTADRTRGTGGTILDLQKAVLLTKKRQPDRYLLVQQLGAKQPIRLHLDLILYFNNQEVV